MDTLKRGFRKVKGEGGSLEDHLNTFLLAYRSTPSSCLENKSPSEIFLGRKLRTTLSLLQPIASKTAEKTQASNDAEYQFNKKHGVKKRSFDTGDCVMVRRFISNRWQWFTGKVLSRLGKVNYNVEFEHGVAKTHANQMRLTEAAQMNNGKADDWLVTMLDVFGSNTRPTVPAVPIQVVPCPAVHAQPAPAVPVPAVPSPIRPAPAVPVAAAPPVAVRRTNRFRMPVKRYSPC